MLYINLLLIVNQEVNVMNMLLMAGILVLAVIIGAYALSTASAQEINTASQPTCTGGCGRTAGTCNGTCAKTCTCGCGN